MKTKQLILGLVTSVLGIVASIFGFLKIFGANMAGEASPAEEAYGFFGEMDGLSDMFTTMGKEYAPAFKTIAGIIAIVIAVATVAYLVFLLIDMKKGNKFSGLRKIVSLVLAICGVLIAICLLIYVCGNSVTAELFGSEVTLKVTCSVFGAIALTAFPVVAGVCGFMAENK